MMYDDEENDDNEIEAVSPKIKLNDIEVAYQGLKKISDLLPNFSENAQNKGKRNFYQGNSKGLSSPLSLTPRMQNSTVIVKYTSNHTQGLWKAHGSYLQRENAQAKGEKGTGFNQDSLAVNVGQTLDNWQKAEDPRLWKIIISPELGDKLDLKEHTRCTISRVDGRKKEYISKS
ncbi:hypothetical protein NOVO_01770 [Rickettsiales bacterium Ac37b]|nr:hypothetical protein NOVO_01770 [Rickettsiales bacterium Ac37b]